MVEARPKARAFRDPAAFRAWLGKHGASASEIYVRCYKVLAKARGLTYREALDEALCSGWIDGVRHAVDAQSFSVRFSPRVLGSAWSKVNVKRAQQLRALGRLREAGAQAFKKRRRSAYSFESRPVDLAPGLRRRLRASRKAWAFFEAQPPWYRRTASFWIMSAKQERTRERRFGILLKCSNEGEAVPPLRRPGQH